MLRLKLNKMTALLIAITLLVFVPACSDDNAAGTDAADHLKKSSMLESDFRDAQKSLMAEEEKEQVFFKTLLDTPPADSETLNKVTDQALKSLEARKKYIDDEKDTLDDSYEAFNKAEDYLTKIDNEDLKATGEKLKENMDNRHETYEKLYDTYIKSIDADKKLFKMLTDPKLKPEELQKQLETVNGYYAEINKEKDQFNKYTDAYNTAKEDFFSEMNHD